ncbi:MAG: TrbG/VirB9 family P-type conjugative transfer protein [Croceibacterium sp.]
MNRALLAAALVTAAAPVLWSAPVMAGDQRLVERLYDPNQVVKIEGHTNVQATIKFDDAEHVENVAIGDSQAWQVTPNRRANLLFVKPLAERAATNMTVVTDKRTYLFDLVASPANRNPLYVLSFTYPPEPEDVQLASAGSPAGPSDVELAASTDPYAVVDPATLNFAWTRRGDGNLLPATVYDDGNAIFLAWAPGTPLPAILIKDQKGSEGPVNYAVRGDVIVIDGVPGELVLRSGEDSATLTNNGPVRAARPPQSLAQASTGPAPATTEVK